MGVIPLLPSLYDEPFSDSSQIPTYLVAKLARQHVTVALSGDGGDEFFAGYDRYFLADRLWRGFGWLPRGVRRGLARILSGVPRLVGDSPQKLAGVLPALVHAVLHERPMAPLAALALYIRSHWLRMPPRLLLPHLARKAVQRLRTRLGVAEPGAPAAAVEVATPAEPPRPPPGQP